MTQAEIDQAIKDQLGPDTGATPNPLLAEAQVNYAREAAQIANSLNQSLITNFMAAWKNWADQVTMGKIPPSNPPEPPAAYVALKASNGWSYVVRGTDPVCGMPPAPLPPPPAPPPIPEPDNVRNVPAGDTLPVGQIVTASDGARWQKKGTPTPFGMAYYYLKVS